MSESSSRITKPIVWLIVCYVLELICIGLSSVQEGFKIVVPLNIIVTLGFVLYYQKHWNLRIIFYLVFIYITILIIEILGTNTDLVYGEYRKYNEQLGISIHGVPLIMCFYWLILIYCIGIMLKNTKYNFWLQALFASVLLLMLDVIVDNAVSKKYLMWSWSTSPYWVKSNPKNNSIGTPFISYIAWFALSFPLVVLILNLKAKLRNDLAPYVFIIMMGFYLLANFL